MIKNIIYSIDKKQYMVLSMHMFYFIIYYNKLLSDIPKHKIAEILNIYNFIFNFDS